LDWQFNLIIIIISKTEDISLTQETSTNQSQVSKQILIPPPPARFYLLRY